MADEDEDLVVTLGEPPPEGEGEKTAAQGNKPAPVPGPSSAQAAQPAVTPETGLKELEQQVAAERAAKEQMAATARKIAAERDQAVRYAQDAERRTGTNYEAYLDSQIQGMTEQMDTLAAQVESAMGDGDFKTAAEGNKRIARIGGALALAEREKTILQQQREQGAQPRQPARQQTPTQPAAAPVSPLERAIAGRTEPTKNFLRKHPELVRGDGTLKKVAIDAHESALDSGHVADSDAYFRYIEQKLGAEMSPTNGTTPPPRQQQPQVPGYSAPVTRGPAPGSDNLAPGTFRMTPKMRRLAEEQGVTPQEWATNYVRLLKEGRITPIT